MTTTTDFIFHADHWHLNRMNRKSILRNIWKSRNNGDLVTIDFYFVKVRTVMTECQLQGLVLLVKLVLLDRAHQSAVQGIFGMELKAFQDTEIRHRVSLQVFFKCRHQSSPYAAIYKALTK